MKKFIMCFVVLLSMSANAANWDKFFIGNDGSSSYVDRESIVNYKNGTYGGWVKRTDVGSSSLTHVHVHCPTKMVRVNETHVYNMVGEKVFYHVGGYWENAMPDTAGMSWVNAFCNR